MSAPNPALHILQHALGLDEHGRSEHREYRNHFVAEIGGSDWEELMDHVRAGLMTRRGPHALYGGEGSYCFTVTDAGRAYVREHSPQPPKVSPGKRRYLEWLRVGDCYPDMKFGDWLKWKAREAQGASR